jgi:hypothetical protein
MNATEEILKNYLITFHKVYFETLDSYIPREKLPFFYRSYFRQNSIIGYISTQFGIGFEYINNKFSTLEIIRSSSRIEDLFLNTSSNIKKLQVGIKIAANNVTISGITFSGVYPFQLTVDHASLRLMNTKFTVNGWSRTILYAELYANRNRNYWTEIQAASRAKDEVFLTLVDLNKSEQHSISINKYLNEFKEKFVLVLGDYSPEGKIRLKKIKDLLAPLGYMPILVDEIPDNLNYDLQQKVVAIGSVARFIVVDDSSKSGHLVEYKLVESNRWITIILRSIGSDNSFMTKGASNYSKVILEKEYTIDNISNIIKEASSWAENKFEELRINGIKSYPWRNDINNTGNGA